MPGQGLYKIMPSLECWRVIVLKRLGAIDFHFPPASRLPDFPAMNKMKKELSI
jgi:hypothetical protein